VPVVPDDGLLFSISTQWGLAGTDTHNAGLDESGLVDSGRNCSADGNHGCHIDCHSKVPIMAEILSATLCSPFFWSSPFRYVYDLLAGVKICLNAGLMLWFRIPSAGGRTIANQAFRASFSPLYDSPLALDLGVMLPLE
jgi:hypothetical protein